MRITFFNNACAIFEQDGFQILSDPWFTDGAFEGSWFLYPPIQTRVAEVADVDALFISHLHPDHFDKEVLKNFRKDISVIVLDHGQNYLHRRLAELGFTNLIKIKDGAQQDVGPFRLTLYAPFEKNIFHESLVGNLLDCAMVLEAGGHTVLNANDNRPSLKAAAELRARHGRLTVAMLNYVAASPYPACFDNFSAAEKKAEAKRISKRNLDHLVEVAKLLEPRFVMPFAGAYVLGGQQWHKNSFIGSMTWDAAASAIERELPHQRTIVLNEGLTFDLDTETIINGTYTPIDVAAQQAYIEATLAPIKYPYEDDPEHVGIEMLAQSIRDKLPAARARLARTQEHFNIKPNINIYIDIRGGKFEFNLSNSEHRFIEDSDPYYLKIPYLRAAMHPALLLRILTRQSHWDNAEIGCHINFVRTPNTYMPDVHTLMAFFHE